MAKPLEQRIGGSNSINNLRQTNLAQEGSHPNTTLINVKDAQGKDVSLPVKAVVITDFTRGEIFTIFTPLRKR